MITLTSAAKAAVAAALVAAGGIGLAALYAPVAPPASLTGEPPPLPELPVTQAAFDLLAGRVADLEAQITNKAEAAHLDEIAAVLAALKPATAKKGKSAAGASATGSVRPLK